MATTDNQIEAVRAMCLEIRGQVHVRVKSAHVDDWGTFGNFTVHITPEVQGPYTTTRLKALVQRLVPPGAHLRQCFAPKRLPWKAGPAKRRAYDRTYWSFDIDFQKYDATSNTFS